MEHVWQKVKKKLNDYPAKPRTKNELWQRLEEVWKMIDPAFIDKLYASIPRRISAVLKTNGGHTIY